MWPFNSRKHPPIQGLLEGEDEWQSQPGHHSGKPMSIRLNAAARPYVAHPYLPVRLTLVIPLRAPSKEGMPAEAEVEQLSDIEDRVIDALGTAGRIVMVVTGNAKREIIAYVHSAELAESAAGKVHAAVKTHPFKHAAVDDPAWAVFAQVR